MSSKKDLEIAIRSLKTSEFGGGMDGSGGANRLFSILDVSGYLFGASDASRDPQSLPKVFQKPPKGLPEAPPKAAGSLPEVPLKSSISR